LVVQESLSKTIFAVYHKDQHVVLIRKVDVLVLCHCNLLTTEHLELATKVYGSAEIDLLLDFLDCVIEKHRHVEAFGITHGELFTHLLTSVLKQTLKATRVYFFLSAHVKGDSCTVDLIIFALERENGVRNVSFGVIPVIVEFNVLSRLKEVDAQEEVVIHQHIHKPNAPQLAHVKVSVLTTCL